jgi:hypothetical protein
MPITVVELVGGEIWGQTPNSGRVPAGSNLQFGVCPQVSCRQASARMNLCSPAGISSEESASTCIR